MITLPKFIGLNDWADQVILDLDKYGAFGRLDDEKEWQSWAVQFLNNSSIGRNIPNPYHFKEWQDWADRFCQSLS